MSLPFDVARCKGLSCGQKTICKRYMQLSHLGGRTPICSTFRTSNGCDKLIPVFLPDAVTGTSPGRVATTAGAF